MHTGKLDSQFKADLVNATKWQYYGTPNVSGSLQMTWKSSLVRADKINIELWGYRETGKYYFMNLLLNQTVVKSSKCMNAGTPYSDDWQAEWKYLYSLAKNHTNNGSFSFVPEPAPNGFSSWELGMLRVSPSIYPDGVWYVPAQL